MANQQIIRKKNIRKYFKFYLICFFILSFLVIGITVLSLGIDKFNTFISIQNYYSTLRPDMTGFNDYWTNYNLNAIANNWGLAEIDYFVIGLVFLSIGFILLVTYLIYFLIKKVNKNKQKE